MCKKYLKPHGPVLATLHVSVNNGRPNDVTKCKELLAFVKEQVLPKTLKMISLKRLKKIKDGEKSGGGNFLSCIWPGKARKRFVFQRKPKLKPKGYESEAIVEDYWGSCRESIQYLGAASFQVSGKTKLD